MGNEMVINVYPYEGYVIPGDDPQPTFTRGDVNDDQIISIKDVTDLINYLLTEDATGINLEAANCNQDETISIKDVTVLINYLLTNEW